jgi:TrmH family RNA methyltransferase
VLTEQITSRQNPLIKRAQRVRAGDEPGFMFIEGVRLVEEAVASDIAVEAVIYTLECASGERGRALLASIARSHYRGALVPASVMDAICDVETPQGIVALAAQPRFEMKDLFDGDAPLVVALDALQDPGNVGAIVRAAEAAGASGVAASSGTAEPYGPKALRASMGSAFRLPVVRRAKLADVAAAARARGVRVLAATAEGGTAYTEVNWREPAVVLVGNEGAGLSREALALASATVTIPLAAPVESLNASVAAAVLLFEAARQRAVA